MKKTNLLAGFSIATVALAVVVNINVFSARPTAQESLLDENIEALTNGETLPEYRDCYPTVRDCPASMIVYCGTCDYIPGAAQDLFDLRKCIKK